MSGPAKGPKPYIPLGPAILPAIQPICPLYALVWALYAWKSLEIGQNTLKMPEKQPKTAFFSQKSAFFRDFP